MDNMSGWFPLLHRVLVLPEEVEIKKGAIYVPEEFTARDEQAQVTGVFVAAGPEAFKDQRNSVLPKPGDNVMFGKLAGFFVRGADGKKYRMINDLDLVAVQGQQGVSDE